MRRQELANSGLFLEVIQHVAVDDGRVDAAQIEQVVDVVERPARHDRQTRMLSPSSSTRASSEASSSGAPSMRPAASPTVQELMRSLCC